jgi:hypothetical protein
MAGLGKAMYAVGFWIRETGQALDRLGCRLQGKYFFHEQSKWLLPSGTPRPPLKSPSRVRRLAEHYGCRGDFVCPERPKGVSEWGLLDRVRSS